MEHAVGRILAGRVAEFSCRGGEYLIQAENNKGYDYLGLWRVSPGYTCLNRVFFDLSDGVTEDTVLELLDQPWDEEHTVREVLESPEIQWKESAPAGKTEEGGAE